MKQRFFIIYILVFFFGATVIVAGPVQAQDFQGGGASIYLGAGTPNSIDAASDIAADLNINDETGNFVFGVLGFYQADKFRMGAAFQMHAWAGVNPGTEDVEDDAAGVMAVIWGVYSTYTIKHDRFLMNVGAIVGSGRAVLGFSYGEEDIDENESVDTLYIEPLISFGVAACRWFGAEFQVSAPLFFLSQDLELDWAGETYTVESSEMSGVNVSLKLTFGKIADP
ncbi:hypothetical protein ACFL27_21550 [candidate division CSSED10-310 bacterium]|uniref:Outer membrane protein beta-barrel domain-containing protein n=1 Tax=candidate division CSSED10-310 bacterium TaxID=2855610 RepID=A0ABV6Z2X7_UNCC1